MNAPRYVGNLPARPARPRPYIHGTATHYEVDGGTGYATVCPACRRRLTALGALHTFNTRPDGTGGHTLDLSRPIEDTGDDCDFCDGRDQ